MPRRLRADWRQEWEAEMRSREALLSEWDKLDRRNRLDLLRRSAGAFWDALCLQPRRLEDEMFQDLRYGARMLRSQPAFTAVAVFCLALGIGANTAIFGLLNAVFFRPLPVAEPGRLVELSRANEWPVSYPDFKVLRDNNNVLSGLAVQTSTLVSFGNGERSEVVRGSLVSGDYFDTLGVKPALGRTFLPEEDRAPGARPVVIISHNFWQSRFNGDPAVIGRTIVLNNYPFTCIGVAPSGFDGLNAPMRDNLWAPVMMYKQAMRGGVSIPSDDLLNDREFPFGAIGRLKPGVSLGQAQAALAFIDHANELTNPAPANPHRNQNQEHSLRLAPPRSGFSGGIRELAETPSKLLSAAVITILLIACANVANLLLARASTRRKEIAVRLALGATRFRLIRQLLMESSILALAGAGAGLIVAYWINQMFMAFKTPFPPPFAFSFDLHLDGRAFGFTLLLAIITGLLFGLAPALRASKPDLVPALKDESGSEERLGRRFNLRDALVIAQVALSLSLLIGAGLFIRSLLYAQRIDLGFEPDKALDVNFDLKLQGYDEARGREFYRQIVERLERLSGVQSASVANMTPMGFIGLSSEIEPADRNIEPNESAPAAIYFAVGRRYFETIGARLLRGRDFGAQDSATSPSVAIISGGLARRLWPEIKDDGEAIGKRLRVTSVKPAECEVIGIAKDSKISGFSRLDEPPPLTIYRPFAQHYSAFASVVVRASGDPRGLIPAVRREVAAIDPNLPPNNIQPLTENVRMILWLARTGAVALGIFGFLGMTLAAIGIYGVMSYSVARRTREIGVRMALGAQAGAVLKLVVGKGLRLALVGSGIGLALAFAVTRLLRSFLYGVGTTDPATFAGVTLFLIAVALAACYLPARQATRIGPLAALRRD
ncbi:MAG: ABC transporter permease [Chloracidobacterium sp.]|nr:ABC transporter permease [Chloracidobacterium sp.]